MATFDAGLEDLNYDFTKYVPGCKGTIPEPTSGQIQDFMEMLGQVMPITEGPGGKPMLDLATLAAKFNGDEGVKELELLVNTAISDVCSGVLTPEQIDALPHRVKQRFYGWIIGTLLDPEA